MFFRIILCGLVLAIVSPPLMSLFGLEFGKVDFWLNHGWIFLISITLCPRLTLLLSSVPFGGVLWWLGFLFAPRLLVAVLATIAYWNTNPILVSLAWFVSFSGESGEKYVIHQRVRARRVRRDDIDDGNVIDI